jgi:xanthine dehydrogenase YagR molybdenum-binding subunit
MSDEQPPWGETTVVGEALPRIDAYERVSGTALYAQDLILPDMLHAAILRCPHAQVKKVTSMARTMPGVRAVISGDTPGADVRGTSARPAMAFEPAVRSALPARGRGRRGRRRDPRPSA